MITTVEGQTVWTFTEPTLEQITSGDYTLPVNFKIVDIETSTYKLVSFVTDSQNGARKLELGGGVTPQFRIEDYDPNKIYSENEVFSLDNRFNEYGNNPSGIYRSDISDNKTALSSWLELDILSPDFATYTTQTIGQNTYLVAEVDINEGDTILLRPNENLDPTEYYRSILVINASAYVQAGNIDLIDVFSNYVLENIDIYKQNVSNCEDYIQGTPELLYTVDSPLPKFYQLISCPITDNLYDDSVLDNSTILADISEPVKVTTDSYSLNEIKTDKVWIDNKPIYRKVISGIINNSINQYINYNSISSDIKTIISTGKLLIDNGDDTYTEGIWNGQSFSIGVGAGGQKDIIITKHIDNGFLNSNFLLVVEYTKTTDA